MPYKLYVEAFTERCDKNEDKISVTLETFIVLFVLEFLERPSDIKVFLVATKSKSSTEPAVEIRSKSLDFTTLSAHQYASEIASNCSFPVIVSQNVVIAGLCSVCRAAVKYADESFKYLLGFKESCLNSPSEASPWTKFCEVDIVSCTKNVLVFHEQIVSAGCSVEYELPNEFGQFESHLNQPVKAHNILKLALNIAKSLKIDDSQLTSSKRNETDGNDKDRDRKKETNKKSISTKDVSVEHKFVEGPQSSIADIILFPYFWQMQSVFNRHSTDIFEKKLPLTHKWIEAVKSHSKISNCVQILSEPKVQKLHEISYIVKDTESFTLYKRESKRYKPSQRIFTRDHAIEQSLNKINQFEIEISSVSSDAADEYVDSNWMLPFDALPEGGNLPENRLKRKKDQLFSLAREVMKIAKDGDRIIDFCSGQGHLAIILAYKLPQCLIYVLDNKEESISRARQRVKRLNLNNIRFFQCNLDYFIGDFDIGTSLHACGIATDIVLLHCKQRHANFVCCPCCYGKVSPMPHISYPRSKYFRSNNITLEDYICIAHCADQAHDAKSGKNNIEKCIQGQHCMDIIDTDRKLYMEECGYNTQLTRLYPEDCTPKNRLLVGTKHPK